MDKVDGPYYFFGVIKAMRDRLPAWLPLAGVDLGDTNVVPVDYVSAAMDHIAHLPDRDGEAFHLVNPEPQPVHEMINAFCAAAGAPRFMTPIDRRRTRFVPRPLTPAGALNLVTKQPLVQSALDIATSRVGIPAEVLAHTSFPARSRRSRDPASASPTSTPTRATSGPTGRSTSTTPPGATRGSARSSPASTSSSPAPRPASAR
jgi:hypothetical protein